MLFLGDKKGSYSKKEGNLYGDSFHNLVRQRPFQWTCFDGAQLHRWTLLCSLFHSCRLKQSHSILNQFQKLLSPVVSWTQKNRKYNKVQVEKYQRNPLSQNSSQSSNQFLFVYCQVWDFYVVWHDWSCPLVVCVLCSRVSLSTAKVSTCSCPLLWTPSTSMWGRDTLYPSRWVSTLDKL